MRVIASGVVLGALLALTPSSARGQELMELLQRGPVVLVENNAQGKFHAATAVIHIRNAASAVWEVAIDFEHYSEFMPKLVVSSPKPVGPNLVEVSYEVEAPGFNPEYTFRYELDPKTLKVKARWVDGDLEGSFAGWHVVPMGDAESLFYYTAASRNFSSIATALDDELQTITVGINVTAALAVVKAIKHRVEGRPSE